MNGIITLNLHKPPQREVISVTEIVGKCAAQCPLPRKHAVCVSTLFIIILLKSNPEYMLATIENRGYLKGDRGQEPKPDQRQEPFSFTGFSPCWINWEDC